MRTTVQLDEALVKRAFEFSEAKNVSGLLAEALQALIEGKRFERGVALYREGVTAIHESLEGASAVPTEAGYVFEPRPVSDFETSGSSAFDLYSSLDLGKGGWALAPSTETRRGIAEVLRGKRSI
ncbi:MAG: type II toxin-antitoxin system VapB family antitoxin [Thermoanaerobaculia bacterium]|nr:type II toxin-antitoxin system VapB family antitoxin [Thermoanaerobaculia bacterium]